ncbi:MAG: LytTR family DNA-binding domain-containing protein [Chitinophagaceae bacterium]
MQVFKCIVIEDEPLAADVLQDYIAAIPFLQLTQIYPDAIKAFEGLHENTTDVIFLDMHLPKLHGLDFLKALANLPQVIITTAYHDFALQGYDYSVVDYLLKPIEFERFLKAVNKLNTPNPLIKQPASVLSPQNDHLFLNSNNKKVRVYFKDILFIESMKEYVEITTTEKSIVTNMQLGEIEELLPRSAFIRIHRSFVVAKDKIEAYTATTVEINKHIIPIGRSYKETLMHVLAATTKL